MTDPSVPDVSFSGLIDRLPDNNAGAIGPEDVRAIASHSRSISAIVGVGAVLNSAFYPKFGSTPDTTGANTIVESGTSGVRYAKLLSLLDVGGVTKYEKYTGPLSLASASSTSYGITYGSGTIEQPYNQSRAFQYEWDILLEGTDQSYFALTFYYLPSETSWPTTGTGWGNLKIHHSEAIFGTSLVNSDKFHGASSGSKTIVLNPGDTLVPVLEYWGTGAAAASVLGNLSGTGKTGVKYAALTVSSVGVVGSDTDWDTDSDYWSVSSNREKVTAEILADKGTGVDSSTRLPVIIAANSGEVPGTSVEGQPLYRTDTDQFLTYTSSGLGYTKPWNMPWGRVAGVAIGTYSGTLTSTATTAAPTTTPTSGAYGSAALTGMTVNFTAVLNRVYRIHWYVSADANGTTNWNLDVMVGATGGTPNRVHNQVNLITGLTYASHSGSTTVTTAGTAGFTTSGTTITAGAKTLSLNYFLSNGVTLDPSLWANAPWVLWVEDIGPSATGTAPA